MRAKWLWTTVLSLLVVTGCGEGRAIFDIDVFSFLTAVDADTLPYAGPLPPGVPDTIPAQTMNSLGLSSASIVDTVHITGSVDFVNTSGSGTVTFQVYFDTVKSAVYSNPPAFSVSGTVTPGATTTSPFDIPDLATALKPIFLASTIYVGIRVSATGVIQGVARLSALRARIVIQDKIF